MKTRESEGCCGVVLDVRVYHVAELVYKSVEILKMTPVWMYKKRTKKKRKK